MASVQGQAEVEEKVEGIEDAEIDRAEADEEVIKPKPAARPYTLTRAEVYEHEVTHLPYRSWCKHCVFGREESTLSTARTSTRSELYLGRLHRAKSSR